MTDPFSPYDFAFLAQGRHLIQVLIEEREFTWEPRFGTTEGDADLGRPPSYVLMTSVTLRKSHTQFDSMLKPLNCPWISELVSFPSRRNAEFMPVFIPLKTLVKNRGKSSRLISLCRRRPPTSRLGCIVNSCPRVRSPLYLRYPIWLDSSVYLCISLSILSIAAAYFQHK